MGTFTASLRALGDVQGLPATVEFEDGVLSVAAGDTPIGEWAVKDISMEPIPSGYRIAAEGDQILLEFEELDRFNEELNAKRSRFKRKSKGVKEKAVEQNVPTPEPVSDPTPPPASPVKLEPRPEDETRKPKKPKRTRRQKPAATTSTESRTSDTPSSFGGKVLAWIDGTLDKASDRFGPYLPEWVFTRLMFGIVFVALILAIVMPGLVSAFMLIAGALIIVFGAVAYSDPMLASKWLPGRTTPTHVLLFGVAILMFGVLLGVIAG